MSDEPDSPITLSRADLYELVWSKPMTDLARDFGISDVALAKRCRRLGIPVPGRGYWARVDAGQKPHRPLLPTKEPEWFHQDALTVAPSINAPSASSIRPTESDQFWLSQQIAFDEINVNRIDILKIVDKWHPAIRELQKDVERDAKELRASREADERYEKLTVPKSNRSALFHISNREFARIGGQLAVVPAAAKFRGKRLNLSKYDAQWDRRRGTAIWLTSVL